MRLDKYLKVSRLIKRRSVAKEVADQGRIKVNDQVAKSSTKLREGDTIEIRFGNRIIVVEVLKLKDTTRKEVAKDMYRIVSEKKIDLEVKEKPLTGEFL